ncbi:predicted protein [Bathycoccus prasinos]|uniref:ELMO domain-containing protein n=1 Tax=Bathycoccus prasinos TaxID=41875 RepID=K8EGC8_9CHLO|nr:predicted protein [Bathycoccus prasinos]CCO17076.1 predicted protein [Bathycoccus prasinos]|eukprot:XP_007512476.1 predicted protein [Bathycoccus prasinos]
MNTTTNTTNTNTNTNDDDDENFLLKSRKEMLDSFLSPECDFTRELVERAAAAAAATTTTTTTSTTTSATTTMVQLHAPPLRSKRDRFMSAFKGQIKPLQSHRLLDERERILALSQMPLKWNRRKKLKKKNEKTKTNNDGNNNKNNHNSEEEEEGDKIELEKADEMHRKMVLTIYAKLTGDYREEEIDAVGKHWETIGFQGEDPSTDVRACGALAVANMVSFVLFNAAPAIPAAASAASGNANNGVTLGRNAVAVHRLSRCPGQQFPMCALGVTFTSWSIRVLENGFLNEHINDRNSKFNSVWDCLDSYYVGVWNIFYKTWKRGKYSLKDASAVLKHLEKHLACRTGVSKAIRASERVLDM